MKESEMWQSRLWSNNTTSGDGPDPRSGDHTGLIVSMIPSNYWAQPPPPHRRWENFLLSCNSCYLTCFRIHWCMSVMSCLLCQVSGCHQTCDTRWQEMRGRWQLGSELMTSLAPLPDSRLSPPLSASLLCWPPVSPRHIKDPVSDAKLANYNPVTIILPRPSRAQLHPPLTSQYMEREITFTFELYCWL